MAVVSGSSRSASLRRAGVDDRLMAAPPRQDGLFAAVRVPEYRAVFLAHTLSVCGDQVARVALGILVFDRTHSPFLSGLTYALSYLPWLVGAPLLSRLGDLYPRRRVLVACDVARMVLVGAMALPGVPLALLMVLMAAVSMVAPPFEAARSALLPDLLDEERYYAAAALTNVTTQIATVVGLGGGGAVVGLVSASGALALDAGTFAASAVIVLLGVRRRPAAVTGRTRGDGSGGWSVVSGAPVLRTLVLLACLASAFGTVPEGLAVVLARHLHQGDAAVGPLSAALPLGAVLGSLALTRFVPVAGRRALLFPLAAVSTAPLLVGLARPGLLLLVAVLVVAGAGTAYNIPAAAAFVRAAPDASRARAMGVAQAGLAVSQGIGIAVAGAAAEHLAPTTVVGVSGACGLACVLLLRRASPSELTPDRPRRVVRGLDPRPDRPSS